MEYPGITLRSSGSTANRAKMLARDWRHRQPALERKQATSDDNPIAGTRNAPQLLQEELSFPVLRAKM